MSMREHFGKSAVLFGVLLAFWGGLSTAYADGQAAPDYSYTPEIRPVQGGLSEVWGRDLQGHPLLLGSLRTMKRATPLYHWARKSEEEVAQSISSGGLTEEAVQELVSGGGRVGGGFYVSDNPFDSMSYGEVLEVVDLPKTTLAFSRTLPVGSDAEKNLINAYIQKLPNVRIMDVEGKQTWYNLVDAQDLSKIHIGNASDVLDWLKRSRQVLDPEELAPMAARYPNEPGIKAYIEKSQKYFQDVQGSSNGARNSVRVLQEHASEKLLSKTYLKMNPALLSEEVVDRQLLKPGSDSSNLKFLGLLSRSEDQNLLLRFAEGFVSNQQSSTANTVISFLARSLPAEWSPQKDRVLQKALASSNPVARNVGAQLQAASCIERDLSTLKKGK
jgi:hypothetical protein